MCMYREVECALAISRYRFVLESARDEIHAKVQSELPLLMDEM